MYTQSQGLRIRVLLLDCRQEVFVVLSEVICVFSVPHTTWPQPQPDFGMRLVFNRDYIVYKGMCVCVCMCACSQWWSINHRLTGRQWLHAHIHTFCMLHVCTLVSNILRLGASSVRLLSAILPHPAPFCLSVKISWGEKVSFEFPEKTAL